MRVLLRAFWLVCLILAGAVPAVAGANVVVTIKPVHSLVAGVMAGVGTPHLIVKGSASPHAYSMKPSDARALQNADVVIWVGPQLETFLRKPIEGLPAGVRTIELMDQEGMVMRPVRSGKEWAGAHDHDHGHGHDHDHGNEAFDAHIWLDVENAKTIVTVAAEAIAVADPANAQRYQANAAALVERLTGLRQEMAAQLDPVRERPFLVFHDAYLHLEKRFDLKAVGAVSLGDGRMPGARHIRALKKRISQLGVLCLFSEPQFDPQIIKVIAEGTGVRSGVLDPLGAAIEDGPDLYATMMRSNSKALAVCLGGQS